MFNKQRLVQFVGVTWRPYTRKNQIHSARAVTASAGRTYRGRERRDPLFLTLGTQWAVHPFYPLNRRLGGAYSWSGHFGGAPQLVWTLRRGPTVGLDTSEGPTVGLHILEGLHCWS
jgi:hypothetical protein